MHTAQYFSLRIARSLLFLCSLFLHAEFFFVVQVWARPHTCTQSAFDTAVRSLISGSRGALPSAVKSVCPYRSSQPSPACHVRQGSDSLTLCFVRWAQRHARAERELEKEKKGLWERTRETEYLKKKKHKELEGELEGWKESETQREKEERKKQRRF